MLAGAVVAETTELGLLLVPAGLKVRLGVKTMRQALALRLFACCVGSFFLLS